MAKELLKQERKERKVRLKCEIRIRRNRGTLSFLEMKKKQ